MLLKAMLNNPMSVQRNLERSFESMLSGRPFGLEHVDRLRRPFPAVNIWEDDNALHVESELPGMTLENIEVNIADDELTIRGTRATDQPDNAKTLRRERPAGQFERIIGLPYPVDIENVQAKLIDGVLSMTLPKAAHVKPRKIEIKTS